MILLLFFNFLFGATDSLLVKETEITGFMNAVSMTIDAKENLYILDADKNEMLKYGNDLEFKKRNGKQGWNKEQFDSPTYIDASSGLDIFVSDPKNKRVQRFDLELNYISTLNTAQSDFPALFQFDTPYSTLIVNSNQIYIVDSDNNRIIIFADGAVPVEIFGDYKSGKGQLGRPIKMLKDDRNFIYVLDKESSSIVAFDNLGNYISKYQIIGLETFAIRNNKIHLFDGKAITVYDLDTRNIVNKLYLPESNKKYKFNDIIVLSNERYLLLGKKSLSLWRQKLN
ncbi:MAG TPA: NHL repeat-containing protein [Ignavibacteria bacterium]|nr:NHL repeat-containing protein [Ignavibacteria bacterium]HRB00498.1 NHL repeat-containing protein [Ignavibacteria bacterium]